MFYTEANKKYYSPVASTILDQLNVVAQNCTHSDEITSSVSTISMSTGFEGATVKITGNNKINTAIVFLDTKWDTYNIEFSKVTGPGRSKVVASYEMVEISDFFSLLNKS
tara:strand:+ start:1680 stop:2009 length:330 start_codon:yes stop_codon:yes gene_type:complete